MQTAEREGAAFLGPSRSKWAFGEEDFYSESEPASSSSIS